MRIPEKVKVLYKEYRISEQVNIHNEKGELFGLTTLQKWCIVQLVRYRNGEEIPDEAKKLIEKHILYWRRT